ELKTRGLRRQVPDVADLAFPIEPEAEAALLVFDEEAARVSGRDAGAVLRRRRRRFARGSIGGETGQGDPDQTDSNGQFHRSLRFLPGPDRGSGDYHPGR